MLWFLRKYQKGIFVVVTVIVIASFLFFGTYRTMTDHDVSVPDRVIGKAIDGSEISEKEVKFLTRFIESDVTEGAISGRQGNVFNDGVITNDILKSGLGLQLVECYFEELQGDLEGRLEKFRHFKPYEHPDGVLSMEGSWKMFMPKYYEDFQAFKANSKELSLATVSHLIALYLDQSELPPEMMRKFLRYQEQQFSSQTMHDQYLDSGDLSLFYAKSLTDWFGFRFVEMISNFIYNSAIYAESKGYQVSFEEARASLLQIGMKNISAMDRNQQITPEVLTRSFHRQLRSMGMGEHEAVAAWQKVLLFRKMFEDVGGSIQLDLMTFKEGAESDAEQAIIQVYELPKEMQAKTLEDALKVEVYLDAVGDGREKGEVPTQYLSTDDLKQTCPELLEKRFLIEMSEVRRADVALGVSMKKTWDWQTKDQNWKALQDKFPKLQGFEGADAESRFTFLQEIDDHLRLDIDAYARDQILSNDPNLIRESLTNGKKVSKIIHIPLAGNVNVLPGIVNGRSLVTLLDKVAEDKVAEDERQRQIAEALSCYTQDEDYYYAIRVVDKSERWDVMRLNTALQNGILDELLSRQLKAMHRESGVGGTYDSSVEKLRHALYQKYYPGKEEVIAQVYSPLMDQRRKLAIEDRNNVLRQEMPKGEVGKLPKVAPLEEQFKLRSREITVTKSDAMMFIQDDPFALSEGAWSETILSKEGTPVFYEVKAINIDEKALAQSISDERYLLGKDAKKALMKTFLAEMKEKVTFEWSNGS